MFPENVCLEMCPQCVYIVVMFPENMSCLSKMCVSKYVRSVYINSVDSGVQWAVVVCAVVVIGALHVRHYIVIETVTP